MIQSKGGEQIKGETLDDPQLVEVGRGDGRGPRPGGPEHGAVLPRRRPILGITDINTRFGGAFPLPQAAGAGYVGDDPGIAAGERPEPRVGAHRPGVVMTRYLDQTLLRREPSGLAPLRSDR